MINQIIRIRIKSLILAVPPVSWRQGLCRHSGRLLRAVAPGAVGDTELVPLPRNL